MRFLCNPIKNKLNDPRWYGVDKTPKIIEAEDEDDCYKALVRDFGLSVHKFSGCKITRISPWRKELVECMILN